MKYPKLGTFLCALSIVQAYGGLEAICADTITDSVTRKVIEISHFEAKRHQSWADKVIQLSKDRRGYSIVVNKTSRELDLYFKGDLVYTFPVNLGFDPIGDKQYEGDGRTPEGIYRVSLMKDKDHTPFPTKYYKALLLNYPTQNDRLDFVIAKRKGQIPTGIDSPGGDIEIHGNGLGQGGRDWTGGCIALTTEHMDLLYAMAKRGTPVAIVKYYIRK